MLLPHSGRKLYDLQGKWYPRCIRKWRSGSFHSFRFVNNIAKIKSRFRVHFNVFGDGHHYLPFKKLPTSRSSLLALEPMFWQSKRIHHATSLSRVRMVATFSGSFRIEFSSNSFGSLADRSSFLRLGQSINQRRATSVSSQIATTSGLDRKIKWKWFARIAIESRSIPKFAAYVFNCSSIQTLRWSKFFPETGSNPKRKQRRVTLPMTCKIATSDGSNNSACASRTIASTSQKEFQATLHYQPD